VTSVNEHRFGWGGAMADLVLGYERVHEAIGGLTDAKLEEEASSSTGFRAP
jgi:hypothetical protein